MQSLLESLPNYIHYDTTMKPYQEINGITSIIYNTTMRSHQEVHRITSITPNTTMKPHQEFHGITSILNHSHVSPTNHRFIKHNNLMPISNQTTNHVSCTYSYQAHQFQSINHIIHAYSHTSCFKQGNPINHVTNNQKHRRKQHQSTFLHQSRSSWKHSLRQERFSRSSEPFSPRRELKQWNNEVFAFSRLGETSSPERDDFSLKIRARRLSDNSSESLGGFVILSLRRDLLAWARISVFPTIRACNPRKIVQGHIQFNLIQA